MSDAALSQDAQQKLLFLARSLASRENYRACRDLQVSLKNLDAAMSGMEMAERIFIKQEFSKAGLIVG